MLQIEVVDLLVSGIRVEVPREVGFEVFDRHRALLAEGRVEAMVLTLPGTPAGVLHLVLGAGSLALLDQPVPASDETRSPTGREDLTAGDVFVDFDAYLP